MSEWLLRPSQLTLLSLTVTAGFFTGAIAMLCAALVQHYAYETNPCGYSAATCTTADSPTPVRLPS